MAGSKGVAFATVIARANTVIMRNASFMRGMRMTFQQDLTCI
jgi:hypothetical protein